MSHKLILLRGRTNLSALRYTSKAMTVIRLPLATLSERLSLSVPFLQLKPLELFWRRFVDMDDDSSVNWCITGLLYGMHIPCYIDRFTSLYYAKRVLSR